MNLDRKILLGVQKLHEERKAPTVSAIRYGMRSEDFAMPLAAEVTERQTGQWAMCHDALRVFAIDDIPGLRHGAACRTIPPELLHQTATTPNVLPVQRFEDQGMQWLVSGHASKRFHLVRLRSGAGKAFQESSQPEKGNGHQ